MAAAEVIPTTVDIWFNEETTRRALGMANMTEHPVLGVLADMEALVASKAHDYADNQNVYSNFEGAAKLAGLSTEQVFHTMVGIKMERLRQLMSGKVANHEGIEDTLMDAANYLALWLGYRRQQEQTVNGWIEYETTLDKLEGV